MAELHAMTIKEMERLIEQADLKAKDISTNAAGKAYWGGFRDGLRRALTVYKGEG